MTRPISRRRTLRRPSGHVSSRTATGAGEPPSLTGGADCASVVAQRGDSRPPRCAIAPPPGDGEAGNAQRLVGDGVAQIRRFLRGGDDAEQPM